MVDDEEPTRPKRLIPLVLDGLGVAELATYIGELNAEIERVEGELARKRGHRLAAESVFGGE